MGRIAELEANHVLTVYEENAEGQTDRKLHPKLGRYKHGFASPTMSPLHLSQVAKSLPNSPKHTMPAKWRLKQGMRKIIKKHKPKMHKSKSRETYQESSDCDKEVSEICSSLEDKESVTMCEFPEATLQVIVTTDEGVETTADSTSSMNHDLNSSLSSSDECISNVQIQTEKCQTIKDCKGIVNPTCSNSPTVTSIIAT